MWIKLTKDRLIGKIIESPKKWLDLGAYIPLYQRAAWQIEEEKVGVVTDFVILGFKITADGDCSHEIRRCLLLSRKAVTNLDSVLKNRHYPTNRGLYCQGYAEVETPVFWSSDASSWLIRKVPDAGKDWGQKKKRAPEDEMTGWHHQCNGHELRQISGDGEGQRGLACCSPWGHKETQLGDWTIAIIYSGEVPRQRNPSFF